MNGTERSEDKLRTGSAIRRRWWLPVAAIALIVGAIWGVRSAFSSSDPSLMLRDVIRHADPKNRDATVNALDEILRLHPNHVDSLIERAGYGDTAEESLDILSRVRQGPATKVAKARLMAGNFLLDLHRARLAEVAFREVVKLVPDSEEAHYRLIPLLAMQRRPAAVRAQLETIRSIRPLTLAEMALWITTDGRLTSFDEAIPTLQEFVKADPEDRDSLRGLCIYLAEESRRDEAIRRLTVALDQSPDDRRSASLLARLLMDERRFAEAVNCLSGFTASQETTDEEWSTLAELALAVGDLDRARMAAEFAAVNSPFQRSSTYLYFRILTQSGDVAKADDWQKRVDLLNSLHAEVETVGITIVRQKNDPRPVLRVAELLLGLSRPKEAMEWLQMAEKMAGSNPLTTELSRKCEANLAAFERPQPRPPIAEWNAAGPLVMNSPGSPVVTSAEVDSGGIQLSDQSHSHGLDFQYENGHTGFKYLIESMGAGVGVVDFDNDGWPDIYCPQGGTLGEGPIRPLVSDQLFRNQRGSFFQNVTDRAGIQEYGYSQGLAIGDINHDGFDDIVVANFGRNVLYLNLGDGTFDEATAGSGLGESATMSASMALADLDCDGDLDLYVVNYVDGLRICRDDKQQISTCNPSSHKAAADELFENLGNGQFRDVTSAARIEDTGGKGLGIVVARLDDDRWPDVFISNDTTPNFLFSNHSNDRGLQFEERGFPAGVAVNFEGQAQAGMGIACGDFDHDLRLDLYVTNFYREPNSLLLQREPGMFHDDTAAAGLREPTLPLLGFGTQAIDLDLDGWVELFVVNGHIDDQTDLGVEWKMVPQLFRTRDGHSWSDVSLQCGDFMHQKALGRGVATLDANRDGRPDIAVGYQDRPMALLINETPQVGKAIRCRLVGGSCNRSAINSVIRWDVDGESRVMEIKGGDGYYCSNERTAFLSPGQNQQADMLEIQWPDGTVDQYRDVAANQDYIIRQGKPMLPDVQ